MMRGRTAAILAATVLLASVVASPDTAVGTDPVPADTRERAYTSASCDQNDQAFDVQPDTPEAWADASAWCADSGEWLDNAPWPSGFTPGPLVVQPDGTP
ncbi:MAG TPA: hypothetical protein VNO31_15430 [Umezawaea sp.]|nr:hypothetical protein [Umezawaea sp.]